MKRRTFVKTSVVGGSVWAAAGVAACSRRSSSPVGEDAAVDVAEFDLNEITLAGIGEKLDSGELTSVALCRKYLDRIRRVDHLLGAVAEVNPDALEIAGRMDEERRAGKIRGPLHGVPVMIKDNIDTGDSMQTTAGSLAMEGHRADADAPLVQRLREAGAVILGKTNLSEWANFRSERSSSGWSGRGGQVRNPWCLDRTPCGSSSGTAAAVSANLCAAGIGTETNGSIVCPSGINGIAGIKPTLGLWSRQGIIPIAHSQDTAGPMARSVTDSAILLGALANPTACDPDTGIPPGPAFTDYTQFLNHQGLDTLKIGIARDLLGFDNRVDELFDAAVQLLGKQGVTIAGDVRFPELRKMNQASYQVLLYEFKHDLNRYLATHPRAPVQSLDAVIAFNELHADREMPWFGQELFLLAQAKEDITSAEYKEALHLARRLSREKGIDAIMEEQGLDAILAATNGPAWTIDPVNGDHFSGGSSSPAAIAGYPNVTVPMGTIHGLPAGISFFGKAWSEPVLLKLAFAYEQASRHRRAPGFAPTLG